MVIPFPRFKVGDRVAAVALPDAFPEPRGRVSGLRVQSVSRVRCDGVPTYYRVFATNPLTGVSIESAERSFEMEPEEK